MTNSLRERRRQLLRDEILDATQVLMAERGYALVSMDEVAAGVGVSKPTLYSHFATKEDLVAAVVMREMEQLLMLIESGNADQPPLERLRRLMHRMVHLMLSDGTMSLRAWTPELAHLLQRHEGACGYLQRMSAATMALIQAAITRGEIDAALDPPTVMHAFFGLVTSLKFEQFNNDRTTDPAVAATTLITIFERGVRAIMPTARHERV